MESAEWAGRNERFKTVVVPLVKEIRRLARSLTNSGADAEDVLQEATVRLLRFIHGYRGRGLAFLGPARCPQHCHLLAAN